MRRVLRTALLALALVGFSGAARSEPIWGEGGEELEALVTREAAQHAFEYLVYFPKARHDRRDEPQTANEKTKQASILYAISASPMPHSANASQSGIIHWRLTVRTDRARL